MVENLDTLLRNLHSDDAKLSFLKSIYTPGNAEVADRILAVVTDSSVIEKELGHARQSGNTERFEQMARKHIDYHVENGHDILLRDHVIQWGDADLADYAVQQMVSKSRPDKQRTGPLEHAAEIAQSYGKPDEARRHLVAKLAIQLRDTRFGFTAAHTLKELGRFDESIDLYLEEDTYGFIDNAFYLAKEHSPSRLAEVAEIGFNRFKIGSGFEEFYVECAEVLGRTDQARGALVQYAKKVKIVDPPRFYEGLVKALVTLDMKDLARDLTLRVSIHENEVESDARYSDFKRPYEMAALFHTIGETEQVRQIYEDRINQRIEQGHHPSHALIEIKKAIELTGDTTFREKEIDIHERQQDYGKAAALAEQLGKPELAQTYRSMERMVRTAQPVEVN